MEMESRIEEAFEYMQNDTDYALELFNGILKEQPKNINALNGKGSTLMKLHKSKEAMEIFDYSLSIEESSSAYLNKGIIAKSLKDYKNALRYFDKSLEHNPSLSSIVRVLKNEIIETANLDDLNSLYNFEEGTISLIKEAIDCQNQLRLWDTLDCLEKAIEEDPSCKDFVDELIEKVHRQLQKEFLHKKYSKNTRNSPNKKPAKNKPKNTKTTLAKTENKKINKLKTLTYRSIIIENNPHKAFSLIERIFEINENDLEGLNLKGIAYFNLGDYDKSLECFDRCLIICDDYTYAYFNKGLVLRRKRLYEESLECFEKALKNPDFFKKAKPYQDEVLNNIIKKEN